eukprot:1157904-Pelagomonas_calceolata.AAC.6
MPYLFPTLALVLLTTPNAQCFGFFSAIVWFCTSPHGLIHIKSHHLVLDMSTLQTYWINKGATDVDKIDVTSATVENVDMHLNMLRGAITSMGGSVDVLEITNGVCKLKYKGPDPIAKGVSAAIRDQFPDIKEVQFT